MRGRQCCSRLLAKKPGQEVTDEGLAETATRQLRDERAVRKHRAALMAASVSANAQRERRRQAGHKAKRRRTRRPEEAGEGREQQAVTRRLQDQARSEQVPYKWMTNACLAVVPQHVRWNYSRRPVYLTNQAQFFTERPR